MKKPTALALFGHILVFSTFYLLTELVLQRIFNWNSGARAIEAGLAGGTVIWFLQLRKWHKQTNSWSRRKAEG